MKKSVALKTLGLNEGATDEEIRKAHRKLIIENHPDKFGQDDRARAQAEEKTKLINEARDVLLNRSWDPEYASVGTAYGAPFSYDPSAVYSKYSTDWPFGETFVWTTWDSSGRQHTYTSNTNDSAHADGQRRYGTANDPFAGFDPFVNPYRSSSQYGSSNHPFGSFFDMFFPREKTPEELLKEARADLLLDIKLIAIKVVILILSFVLSSPATGLFVYTIISIGQGIWKRLHYLSLIFLIPFMMLAIIFAPSGGSSLGIIPWILFGCSVVFDVQNIYRHIKRIYQLKNRL